MKLAVPNMGNIYVPIRALCQEVGVELVVPPLNSKRTLTLGVQHSPEFVCIPYKLTLGNFIEALEMGADTLVMAAGPGLCRFGYYAKLQEKTLQAMGYQFQMFTTEIFESKIVGIAKLLKRLTGGAPTLKILAGMRLALAKLAALDAVEKKVHQLRAVEQENGAADRIYRSAIAALDAARDLQAIKQAKEEHLAALAALPVDSTIQPLRVGLVGELYVVLEPFCNLEIERELGKLGVEVRRSIFLSEWTLFSLFLNALGISEKAKSHRAAYAHLKRDIGGDGWESVGDTILHGGEYDGMVHLAPFTCMPEVMAQNIMPAVKGHIPFLTITLDEQMGRAGMLTRLEAFVDLLRRRRAGKLKAVS